MAAVPATATASDASPSTLSAVSVALSTTAARVPGVTYTVQFTTSASGGLASGSGTITLAAPAGTVFPVENVQGVAGAFINDIFDVTAGQDLGFSRGGVLSDSGSAATWTVEPNIPAGHVIRLTIEGVTSPATGSHQLQVSTSSDPAVIGAQFFTTTPQKLTASSVALTASTAAHATDATYTVQFTTSSTGDLAAGNGQITLAAPAGTVFPTTNLQGVVGALINDVFDVTTDQDLGFSRGGVLSDSGSAATWTVEPNIPAGHVIRLTIEGVTNPGTGSHHLTLSTSSDPAPVTTPSYATTPRQALASAAIGITQPAVAHESGVGYVIQLATSSTGELVPNYGQITVTAPAGTVFPVGNIEGVSGAFVNDVYDVTTGHDFGDMLGGVESDGGSSVTWTVGSPIGANQTIDLTINGVTNPAAGSYKLGVSTSSDTGVQTFGYTIGGTSLPRISGTVSYNSATGLAPVPGSIVQACGAGECVTGLEPTDSQGHYEIYVPATGSYTVTAFAPTSNAFSVGQGSAGPVSATAGAVATQDVTLPVITPLPSGVTFNGQAGVVPSVNWESPAPLTVQGCKGGVGVVNVTSISTVTGAQTQTLAGLRETPPGSGTYTTTLPPLYPSHGTATLSIEIECPPATALLPASGPMAGGNTVQINGTGFTGATKVLFGAVPATRFTVVSDSVVNAVAPAGTGAVQVSVVTPDGDITSASLSKYTYLNVSKVTPADGSAKGGTKVTLTGSGLRQAQAVYFGNSAASDVTVVSGSEITAVAPAGSGSVPVTVLTSDGGQSGPSDPVFSFGSKVASRPASASALTTSTAPAGHVAAASQAGTLTAVSPATQVNRVADEMLEHETAGCVGSDCQAFAVDAAQAVSQIGQDVANGAATAPPPPYEPVVSCEPHCLELPPVPAPPPAPPAEEVRYITCSPVTRSWYKNAWYETDCAPNHVPLECEEDLGSGVTCVPVRIDPSGTVEDTNGHPVANATVTLLHSDSALGPFTAPPSGNQIMSPSVNPETSAANGGFDWEVFVGYYQVTAQKSGCAEPGHPSRSVVSTPVFRVPPPKVGIVLTLKCQGEAPPAIPKVSSLSARSGPAAGGMSLDISGSGFSSPVTVRFGTAKAKSVQVLSPTVLAVRAPAGHGTVSVRVTTPGGTSALSPKDRFTYSGRPSVTKITPGRGPAAGGAVVTITGTGFAAGDQVLFGSAAATAIVGSATKIIATAPPGSGLVNVTVVSAEGASTKVTADRFGYLSKPRFTSASSLSVAKGHTLRFTVRTAGYPFAKVTESGRLPAGLKFTAHANGTATISGKPTAKGRHQLIITARNSLGTAKQTLRITVT